MISQIETADNRDLVVFYLAEDGSVVARTLSSDGILTPEVNASSFRSDQELSNVSQCLSTADTMIISFLHASVFVVVVPRDTDCIAAGRHVPRQLAYPKKVIPPTWEFFAMVGLVEEWRVVYASLRSYLSMH